MFLINLARRREQSTIDGELRCQEQNEFRSSRISSRRKMSKQPLPKNKVNRLFCGGRVN